MESCCHVWAGTPSCNLELFDKLQKRICRTVGSSLAASLETLAHRRNVASLSLLFIYLIYLIHYLNSITRSYKTNLHRASMKGDTLNTPLQKLMS